MAKFEEPYKKGPSKKAETERQIADTKAKEYIKGVSTSRTKVNKELDAMKESMPMSNKTIEYYNNRYEKGRTNQ